MSASVAMVRKHPQSSLRPVSNPDRKTETVSLPDRRTQRKISSLVMPNTTYVARSRHSVDQHLSATFNDSELNSHDVIDCSSARYALNFVLYHCVLQNLIHHIHAGIVCELFGQVVIRTVEIFSRQ